MKVFKKVWKSWAQNISWHVLENTTAAFVHLVVLPCWEVDHHVISCEFNRGLCKVGVAIPATEAHVVAVEPNTCALVF